MGRLCALFLVLAAACGDNIEGRTPSSTGANFGGVGNPTPVEPAVYVPSVCGLQMWTPTIAQSAPDSLLLAAPSTTGAAVVAMPSTGGAMSGFTVDDRMMVANDGTSVLSNYKFLSAAMSTVNGALQISGVDATSGDVRVALVDQNLGSTYQLLKTPGTHVTPMFEAYGERMTALSDANGVTAWHYDREWNVTGSMLVLPTDPATGVTAAAYGDTALVGWSTQDECYLARLPGFAPADWGVVGTGPCPAPRVAGDASGQKAVVVYEYANTVRIAHVTADQLSPETTMLRAYSSAPRVVYDGTRFWVSYIGPHGDLTVGFLDQYNRLQMLDLIGVRPQGSAYDLVMIGGAPWVVSVDTANGFAAHELCATQQ